MNAEAIQFVSAYLHNDQQMMTLLLGEITSSNRESAQYAILVITRALLSALATLAAATGSSVEELWQAYAQSAATGNA